MGVAVILVAMIVLFVPVVVMVMAMIVVPVPMVVMVMVMVMAVVVPMIMPVIMFLGLLEGLAADNAPGRHDHVARRAHILFVVLRVRMGMIMPMPMIVVMPVIMIVGPVLMVVVVVPVVVPVVVIAMVVMGLVFFGHGADACCFARGIIGTEEYPIYGEVLPARQAMV